MTDQSFFPQRPDLHPMIYAYEDLNHDYAGLLKVGYTEVDVELRVGRQYPTKRPDGLKPFRIVMRESALYPDGSSFTDREVHKILKKKDLLSAAGGEWFRCTIDDIRAAIIAVKTGTDNIENRTRTFPMRPEQEEAVRKTAEYFKKNQSINSDSPPKFLWNAKMRFGKTFAAYQLAKKMKLKKILVLTFKPAVEDAWEVDLKTHVDFEGWQFISRGGLTYEKADKNRPIVCFGSFQDYLGVNKKNGGIKYKNEWVHTDHWDLVIFDEYHFGAWRDSAKKLFEEIDEDEFVDIDPEIYQKEEAADVYDESFLPITTSQYLFLSGTPFRALNSGEFIEDQIYSWTYSDEQRAKLNWPGKSNPYLSLPRMVLMTYKIPDSIAQIASQGEFNEFDLNVFFSAKGVDRNACFVYEDYVQKWLNLIRGSYISSTVDDLKLGVHKAEMPYSYAPLLNVLSHTFWFMPNVASCYAMRNLLEQKQNTFYHDYTINVCAGPQAGVGLAALEPVRRSMAEPLKGKTITLSCGKLTTGVTVRPWTGIFMLRNLSSPETYFQAAFRVQSPWEITTEGGQTEILKKECYIFDFALDRALRQVADYSCRLNVNEANPEKKVGEFIQFLPVLAYDGSTMKVIDPGEILDITMAGTSATLLARRWESALLVNVDNDTLARLLANPEAMAALQNIEGFRSLNTDIETIINFSETVKKVKKDPNKKLTPKEKKELTEEEKEYKSKRKQIQDKLIKFATRIPIFMYLTDFREYSLKDVITQFEPSLFKKVTGLSVKDFELLVSLGVFNHAIMNDAVYKFKRYEDSSLSYAGIDKHEGEPVGLFDTILSREDYERLDSNRIISMARPQTTGEEPEEGTWPEDLSAADDPELEEEEDAPETQKSTPPNKKIENSKTGIITDAVKPIDLSSIKVGCTITHRMFGPGKVIDISKDTILVNFQEKQIKFEYPKAFIDGFLTI